MKLSDNNQSHISYMSGVSAVGIKSSQVIKGNSNKPYLEAVEQYKKLCTKTTLGVNNNFLTTLKQESLNLFLENYSLKEIGILNKIIGGYYYFKQVVLAPADVHSKWSF